MTEDDREFIEYPAKTKKGYMEAHEGDGLVLSRPTCARGTVQPGTVPTLTTTNSCGTGTVVRTEQGLRIRELTPRECWRLMGQTDEAYELAAESTVRTFKDGRRSAPSKTALYKAAGNSIAVDALADVFDAMYHGASWKALGDDVPSKLGHEYTAEEPLRVVELFSGIGGQKAALNKAGIPNITVAICDTDPKATAMYCAIYGEGTPNLGDIRTATSLPPCDLVTYSFPCQSISRAGMRDGLEEGSGSKSSLVWEVGRLLRDAKRRGELPPMLVMENVRAILDRNNAPTFAKWIATLRGMGYESTYAVVNAKDHGLPQNRERCFMVSTLRPEKFVFPPKRPLACRLRDILEDEVPEEYYLSEQRIATFQRHKERHKAKGNGFGIQPLNADSVAHTVTVKPDRDCSNFLIEKGEFEGVHASPELEVEGLIRYGDSDFESCRRVYDPDGISPALTTSGGGWRVPKITEEGKE